MSEATGLVKKGVKSAGVQRQYSGTAGRVANCQSGGFLAYATTHGRAVLDRELYPPQAWAEGTQRRERVGIPQAVQCATKLVVARRMSERAGAAGVPLRWATGAAGYGTDRQRRSWVEKHGRSAGVAVTSPYQGW